MADFNLLPSTLYEVGLRWRYGPSKLSWYYGWYLTRTMTLPADATAQRITASHTSLFLSEVGPFLGGGIVFDLGSCREFDVTTGFTGREHDAPVVYTTPSPIRPLPPAVAVLCRFRTSALGPRGRGRIFISGLRETLSTGGEIAVGTRNALQIGVNSFARTPLWAFDPGFVNVADRVLKRGVLGPNLSPPFDPVLVTSGQLDSVLRQQRRRVPR